MCSSLPLHRVFEDRVPRLVDVLIPDMQPTTLQVLRWDAPGQWTELAHTTALPARVERLTPMDGGG